MPLLIQLELHENGAFRVGTSQELSPNQLLVAILGVARALASQQAPEEPAKPKLVIPQLHPSGLPH